MNVKRSYSEIAADVAAAQRGDAAAMDRIIADIQDSVYYTCLSILHSEDAAQDAAQDVLLTAIKKLNSLKNTGAYIGWVNRITANICKERLSKPNHEIFLEADEDGHDPFAAFEDLDEQSIPEKALDNAETQRMIVELVNALPDEQRMCVLLYYFDGMKTREIADALDVAEGTVKSRLNYARKTLKDGVTQLEKQGVSLHGLSPIPFLAYYLGRAAEGNASPVTAQLIRTAAGKTAAAASTAASGTAAGTTAGAAGTAAAAATGSTVAVIGGRILAGILAIGLLVGIGFGIYHSFDMEPPVIPEEELAAAATPEPTPTQQATAEPSKGPSRTAEPEAVYLYGETCFYGARFTVDQTYRGDMIRVQYENDEMSFVLGGAQFELETEAGTFVSQTTGDLDGIGPEESGYFELTWENTEGKPVALTVRGVDLQNPGAPSDAAFRIVFTDMRQDRTERSDRIYGQAQYQGLRLTVDQIYTDDGLGKIVLRAQNNSRRILFGVADMSAMQLLTDQGSFEGVTRAEFDPNASTTMTLYFNNAEGMPSQLIIGDVYTLDADGNPSTETGETVTLPLITGERPTAAPILTPAPTATPAPAATPAPTAAPGPTAAPDYTEWSREEPPEGAQGVETRQLYHKRGIYKKEYRFGEYSKDSAEEAEAAIDAAIAADLAALASAKYTSTSEPTLSKEGDDWTSWSKTVRVSGEYTKWTLWTGDNNALRDESGLPYEAGQGYRLNYVDFQLDAEYRYWKQ